MRGALERPMKSRTALSCCRSMTTTTTGSSCDGGQQVSLVCALALWNPSLGQVLLAMQQTQSPLSQCDECTARRSQLVCTDELGRVGGITAWRRPPLAVRFGSPGADMVVGQHGHNTRVRGMSSAAALRSMAASRLATRRVGYAPGSNGFKKGIQN
jgi:hypothetical protein